MLRYDKNLLWLSALVVVVFGVVIYRQLPVGDYQHHIEWARELASQGYVFTPPNNLFQNLVVITRALIPLRVPAAASPVLAHLLAKRSYDLAALLVMLGAFLSTAWLIYARLRRAWGGPGKALRPGLAAALALALMLVGPIFLLTLPERTYLGYITGNAYHNPTVILLKPLALLVFYRTLVHLEGRSRWPEILVGAILIALATQAKPNFSLTFLPAVALFVLLQIRRLRSFDWPYLAGGLALPAVLILGEQYFMTYTGAESDAILFAPFRAILQYVPNVITVFWFILLSVLFPLAFTLLHWRAVRDEPGLRLAWLNFAVALLIALLFAEKIQMGSLNFWWGPMVALFILFIETLALAGKFGVFDLRDRQVRGLNAALIAVFALHLACGLIYTYYAIAAPAPII